jgi:hypothetical protein
MLLVLGSFGFELSLLWLLLDPKGITVSLIKETPGGGRRRGSATVPALKQYNFLIYEPSQAMIS